MVSTDVTLEELQAAIRDVPDFPEEGIQFKDITPVLADARLLDGCISHLLGGHSAGTVDVVAGIDARGFIFGAAMARELGVGFVPIRKKGKLPWQTIEESYDLEYGSNTIAIHTDAVTAGQRVLLMDDLLARAARRRRRRASWPRPAGRWSRRCFSSSWVFSTAGPRWATYRCGRW